MDAGFLRRVVFLRAVRFNLVATALVFSVLSALAVSVGAQTITITGASTGIFLNADGGVTSGVGTNRFTWGDPGNLGTGPSALSFVGTSFNTSVQRNYVFGSPQRLSDVITLGTLEYFNGAILPSSRANSVALELTFSLTTPSGLPPGSSSGTLVLIDTPNTTDPVGSADFVLLPVPTQGISSVVLHTPDGVPLTLQDMHFGPVNGSGFGTLDEFFVLEGRSASAPLLGRFRPPCEEILRNATKVPITLPEQHVMSAFFLPNFRLTLTEAAVECGYDHFNWYQRVTEDPYPPGGLSVPYIDPPNGGGVAFQGAADNLPFYWDESGENTDFLLSTNTPGDALLNFADVPKDGRILPGQFMKFTTALVGVRVDGSFELLYVFDWKSNFNGISGGVSRRGSGGDEPGTGGIFDVRLDLTEADLSEKEKAAMARDGATNISSADITPPAISLSATPQILWPPNGKITPVGVVGAISDDSSGIDPATVAFSVVDDYGLIQPSGPVALKADGSYAFVLPLEARRAGNDRTGRDYRITITATDFAGNVRSRSTLVTVPHDKLQR